MITTQEKLAAVERLIEDFRWARNKPGVLENETYRSLKAIASDLRARLAEAPHVAEIEIERRVRAVVTHGGLTGHLCALAHEVVARWPVIKQALARFGALAEEER